MRGFEAYFIADCRGVNTAVHLLYDGVYVCVGVVNSLTYNQEELARIHGVCWYEHRVLYNIFLLGQRCGRCLSAELMLVCSP